MELSERQNGGQPNECDYQAQTLPVLFVRAAGRRAAAVSYLSDIQPVLRLSLPVFLALWLVMLVLMGLAGYLVYQSRSRSKQRALRPGGYLLMGFVLWGLFTLGLNLPLVGLVLMAGCALCALKFAAESLWVNKGAFFLCGAEFLWAVYLAANSFFLWRL